MEQNTNAWYHWRKEGIGASDAPVIMGDSKYKTPLQLYREKISQDEIKEENNFIQRKGHALESEARAIFELMVGKPFEAQLFQHKNLEFLRASVDGYNANDEETWEGKYVGEEKFKFVKENEKVLPEHYAQVQHQLVVTGAKHCWYMVYTGLEKQFKINKYFWFKVEPDQEYIKDMVKKESEFWFSCVRKDFNEFSKDDSKEIEDQAMKLKLARYHMVKREYDVLKVELDAIKEEIFGMVDHPKMHWENFRITERTRRTTNYKKALEFYAKKFDFKVDYDNFLNVPSMTKTISMKDQ